MKNLIFFGFYFITHLVVAQVWVADRGDGTYQNPILHADYSDPDAIRVGTDFYMISSSFNYVPGIPILHSKDLVSWSLIGHALPKLQPVEHFKTVHHGGGVWAPALRHHNGLFYIYYPDPDFGIYMISAGKITGPWSEPVMVKAGKGLIDPCPFWDTDGKAYLIYAFAGSRAGVKSVLLLDQMTADGKTAIEHSTTLVFDGHKEHATIEGPKMHKRSGYYYISAPAGGVATGWQLILRSKNIYGPYEEKIVLEQGDTPINGPHQGAWVDTPTGEWWFLHFQDKDAYGRIVHLQPVLWKDNWPIMGNNGKPVLNHKKPNVGQAFPTTAPPENDEFNSPTLGLQWQWPANREVYFGYPSISGYFRLNTYLADSAANLYDFTNFMLQKFPAEEFTASTKIDFNFSEKLNTEQIGFVVKGFSYAFVGVTHKNGKKYITYNEALNAKGGKPEKEYMVKEISQNTVYFRIKVGKNALCDFYFSIDGNTYIKVNQTPFKAEKGQWVGAQLGYVAARKETINDAGYADIDWIRIER